MGNASETKAESALQGFLVAIGHTARWRIFSELISGEPMPLTEIARRIQVPVTNTSKHLALLVSLGVIERAYGKLYRLSKRWIVPGERALDFGRIRIQLDAK